jgi:ribosomal protein S18 acetylase RimI-like enzyme
MMEVVTGECCNSARSWVALDAAGTVIGFILARPDPHERNALSLLYIGVSKESRGQGVSKALMEKLKTKGVPLTASVLQDNQSAMADRLVKAGFTKGQLGVSETKLRWDPI